MFHFPFYFLIPLSLLPGSGFDQMCMLRFDLAKLSFPYFFSLRIVPFSLFVLSQHIFISLLQSVWFAGLCTLNHGPSKPVYVLLVDRSMLLVSSLLSYNVLVLMPCEMFRVPHPVRFVNALSSLLLHLRYIASLYRGLFTKGLAHI